MACSAFLLGQATPDARDLSGAQGEAPTVEQRGARRADRFCAGDPTSPGTRALCVRAEERPVAHSLARGGWRSQAGPTRGDRSTSISGSRGDTRWIRRWRDPVRRVGRVRHRADGGDRDGHAPLIAFSCPITRLASFLLPTARHSLRARVARGFVSPAPDVARSGSRRPAGRRQRPGGGDG